MSKIEKRNIEEFLESKGASTVSEQAALSGFDQCKTDKEKTAFFEKLKKQYAFRDKSNKAVENGEEAKAADKAKNGVAKTKG